MGLEVSIERMTEIARGLELAPAIDRRGLDAIGQTA